ncbi:MAG: hypothetical protein SPL33_10555 [Fibrobacter sp.]|nr:hypothetical protein [Fibrobacter sp.]
MVFRQVGGDTLLTLAAVVIRQFHECLDGVRNSTMVPATTIITPRRRRIVTGGQGEPKAKCRQDGSYRRLAAPG